MPLKLLHSAGLSDIKRSKILHKVFFRCVEYGEQSSFIGDSCIVFAFLYSEFFFTQQEVPLT